MSLLATVNGRGLLSARPAAAAANEGYIYSASDAALYRSNGSSWDTIGGSGLTDPMTTRGDIIVRNASNVTARLGRGAAGQVLTSDGTDIAWQTPSGGGSASDPVADVFGTPDTAFEFGTSSFTGLTAFGSPTTEDANTTIPGAYYVKKAAASGTAYMGRFASFAAGSTAICQVLDTNLRVSNMGVGLLVGVATTLGKFEVLELVTVSRQISLNIYTAPTSYLSTPIAPQWGGFFNPPFYMGVVCNSTTSFDWYISKNGSTWLPVVLATNPSLTIGSVGIGQNCDNASSMSLASAFGFLRIWNSVKTFPQ